MPPTLDEIAAADELRDAAASLRRLANGENLEQVYPEFTPHNVIGALCNDRGTVAHAWLAEHPADDSLGIDAAWLDTLTAVGRIGFPWVWHLGGGPDFASLRASARDWVCCLHAAGSGTRTPLPSPETRGQLRRLLAALGVPAVQGGAPCPS